MNFTTKTTKTTKEDPNASLVLFGFLRGLPVFVVRVLHA